MSAQVSPASWRTPTVVLVCGGLILTVGMGIRHGFGLFLQPMSAELLGMALMGPVEDPATARLARAQLRRTSLGTAISAIQAVCEFTSHSWIGQVDVPAAVVVTARDHIVPVSRPLRLARAIPGASVHEVDADHAACVTRPQLFTQSLLQACWSVTAARVDGTQPGLTGTVL